MEDTRTKAILLLSGDQVKLLLPVRYSNPVPSGLIRWKPGVPESILWSPGVKPKKAIFWPSGDQAIVVVYGSATAVRLGWFGPSGFIT